MHAALEQGKLFVAKTVVLFMNENEALQGNLINPVSMR
jgi:hypothetical protein